MPRMPAPSPGIPTEPLPKADRCGTATGRGRFGMRSKLRAELPQLLLLAAMFGAAAWGWASLEGPIPVHWNAKGAVDRYGGRFEGLLAIPLAGAALYLLLRFVPLLDPERASDPRFEGPYRVIRFGILALLALAQGVILAAASGHDVDVGGVLGVGLGAFLVATGRVLRRIPPGRFVGIRTPWTRASQRAWHHANRVGGWVLVASGLVFAGAGIAGRPALFAAAVGLVALGLAGAAGSSYLVWRRDPDRALAEGTAPPGEGGR